MAVTVVLRRFELPLCPSANVYYRHRTNPNPKLPPITYVSPEGREYQKRVARVILPMGLPRLKGALSVRCAVWFERETGDTDNRVKPLLDALEGAEVFTDDRQVALVEFYRAGISPLVAIPAAEIQAKYEKDLRSWKRKVKKKRDLPAPKLSTRKKRRYGVMLVEIEAFSYPAETVAQFKEAAGWET